jgi:sugar lactone lactonase YvrE
LDLLLDARAELAEGPIWDAASAQLIWVDQLAGTINRAGLDGTAAAAVVLEGRVGCALPRDDGGLVLACGAGFARLEDDGTFSLIAEVAVDAPASFLNDGRCDALGRFWAGSVGIAADGNAAPASGGLHRLDGDGSVTTALRGLSLANGMDWSPDGRTFYLIDSLSGGIDAFEFDLADGRLGPRRRAVELGLRGGEGFADGMCVDADGCLWTAIWGTGEIRRYIPDGALERRLEMPVSQPTSCVFAGPALDVLVITSAWHRLDPTQRSAEPHAGGIFCCRPGVSGLPGHRFAADG